MLLSCEPLQVLHGFAKGWVHRFVRQAKLGIGGDDVLGGNRKGKGKGKAAEAVADAAEDSVEFMSAYGWLKDLREDTECMPNTRERQMDFMEVSELYNEYVQDQLDTGSMRKCIASQGLWRGTWKGHFSDLKIREHKAVSGKNRKRAELRRLMRRTVTQNAADRALIKVVRTEFRHSCRRERGFYWEERVKPAKLPESYMTQISDGATQADYVLPKICALDYSRNGLQLKLVASLYHGHVLVVHLVMPHIPGDANLTCHCIDTSLEEYQKVIKEKGFPGHCPENCRFQMDGVSTNWGLVTFAHLK